MSPIDRLMLRVSEVEGPLDTPCWLSSYSTNEAGYARMNEGRNARYCHVIAYRYLVGPVPEGLELDHLCRVRACCNPTHLEPVTHRENVLRGSSPAVVAARTGRCKHGHSLDDAVIRYDGNRNCRTCRQIDNKRRSLKRAAMNAAMRRLA